MSETNVAVIGLGKLGAPMAACLASLNYNVHVHDKSPTVLLAISAGTAPVQEPQLQEYITKYRDRINVHLTTQSAALAADVIFVIVPTPSLSNGRFDIAYVRGAMMEIGYALRDHPSPFPVVVVTSTVMPGDTNGPDIKGVLEHISGKVAGRHFGLAYSPEFIALGSVIHDWLDPDQVLLGADDQRTSDIVTKIYAPIERPITCVGVASAELAKIAVNTYITAKINFANTLARICERTPDADVDDVTKVMGYDTRIGDKYLKGGTPFGGPCFPRDNRAMSLYSRKVGISFPVTDMVDQMNNMQARLIAEQVQVRCKNGDVIGVIGLAYKSGTAVTEEAAGIVIANNLSLQGYPVFAWDPIARRHDLITRFTQLESLEELLNKCSVIVITQPDMPEVTQTSPLLWTGKTVVDCWRTYSALHCTKYVPLGRYLGES